PSVNILHEIYAPQGGTFSASSYTAVYLPGGVGEYTCAAINSNNGCSTIKIFTVTSNNAFPSYTVSSPQNYTLGCNSTSFAVVNLGNIQSGGGGATSYTLLSPGNSAPGGTLSPVTTYTVNAPGTYTVVVRDNVSFCETKVAISILSNTFLPHIDADTLYGSHILNCFDPNVTLVGKSLTPGVIYQWNFPFAPGTKQSDSLTVNTLSATPTTSIVGNFTLQITNSSSTCKSTSVITIYQNLYPPFALAAGLKQITCATQTITLNNQSSTTIPPNTFPRSKPISAIVWQGPSPQEPLYISSSYVAGVPGDYTLTVRDQNNGCTTSTTFPVMDARNYPTLTINDGKIACGKGQGTLNVSADVSSVTYTWSTKSAVTGSTSLNNLPYYVVKDTGTYYVAVTNTLNGCTKATSVHVVSDSLNASFDLNPSSGFAPLTVNFYNNSGSTDSTGGQGVTAIWNFGNGQDTTTNMSNLSPSMIYNQPGTYTVTIYVNKGTCMASATRTVHVEIPSELTIPNIFTPNNDGANDLFFLKASNLSDISMVVYDRWGHIVYELRSDSGNISWDGKNQYGKDCAEGTYFYILKSSGKDGKEYNKKGTITLVR
ncbi:MAG: gliding motility-associated C-terminal domain-containing protein, partial [Bacteroidia bacterium]|nr:gliding motility-associated C-terminal domain-containing protein [Bacteroidia bacterium]